MRVLAIIVLLLGLATLVLGVILVINSGSARDEVAESVAPLPLDQLDDTYENVKAQANAMRATEEPAIQTGSQPSAMYNYLSGKRTSLGLARSNVGLASLTLMVGIVNIIVGAGLGLGSVVMMRKS